MLLVCMLFVGLIGCLQTQSPVHSPWVLSQRLIKHNRCQRAVPLAHPNHKVFAGNILKQHTPWNHHTRAIIICKATQQSI